MTNSAVDKVVVNQKSPPAIRKAELQKIVNTSPYPLCAVEGKAPFMQRWQEGPITTVPGRATGLGIITGEVTAVDVDCLNLKLSDVIKEFIFNKYVFRGDVLFRYGKRPKFLVPFRSPDSARGKRSSAVFVDEDGNKNQIEILGQGQQFVAYGIHPDTGNTYEWEEKSIFDVGPDQLPELTDCHIDDLLEFFETQAVELGLKKASQNIVTTVPTAPYFVDEEAEAVYEFEKMCRKGPQITADFSLALLNKLDPDIAYDDWRNVGMALKHEFGAAGFEVFNEWSAGGGKYDEADIRNKWNSFKYKQGGVTFGTVIHMVKQVTGEHVYRQIKKKYETPANNESALQLLRNYSSTGRSQEMEKKMLDDKFVLKDIALLGDWTMIYAGPGTGKTLIVLWLLREAIEAGDIDGCDVFYANCDDNYRGGTEKLKIAEQCGFEMLLPNELGFDASILMKTLKDMTQQGGAIGTVLILDTIKKFTDLMSKQESTAFGKLARAYVMAGGTLIALGHVGKHKNIDGKSVYAGTSDLRDDADCCYIIEHIDKEPTWEGDVHTVVFENNKARGDVKDQVTFKYVKQAKAGYMNLFNSVTRVSDENASFVTGEARARAEERADADVIQEISDAIRNGAGSKSAIQDAVSYSRRRVDEVLETYAGRLWNKTVGGHNKFIFKLNEAPAISVISEDAVAEVSFL